jgi:O-antigen ligase
VLLGALLVLVWVARVLTGENGARGRAALAREAPLLLGALILLLAWACMSAAWAEEPGETVTSAQRFALNFTLFPIAILALRARSHAMWLVSVFVVGALVAAVLGLAEGTMSEAATEGRLKGAGLNPNQLGTYLVVAVLFAGTLAANRRWPASARTAWLVVAALGGLAAFMTLSRGALVGLAAALVVTPLVIGRGRRFAAVIVIAAAVVGSFTWYAVVAPAHAVERITNPERGGGSGREDLWRVGWRMVEDQPLIGVGAGNFPEASIHYLLRPGSTQRDEFIVDEKKVAHNIYLTVLSELGAVGLAVFLMIIGQCLRCALRAGRRFAQRGDPTMELIARGLFLALVSLVVADFFSSALYSKQLWVLLALAPALLAIAERSDVPADANVTRLSRPKHAPARAVV